MIIDQLRVLAFKTSSMWRKHCEAREFDTDSLLHSSGPEQDVFAEGGKATKR